MNKKTNRPDLWTAQNFIRREKMVEILLAKTNIGKNDLVIDIGAGEGIISLQLAKIANKVIAIEKDVKLGLMLKDKFKNHNNIKVVQVDFLSWPLPKEDYKIFANIPFNMTAEIVRKITQGKNSPSHAYLFMQNKAAFRFLGKPNETQVSILLKNRFEGRLVTYIDKKEFTPIPKISIVLVELAKRSSPLINGDKEILFRDFVIYSYNAWKPTMNEVLKPIFSADQIRTLQQKTKVMNCKPSQLNIDHWIVLFEAFEKLVPKSKQAIIIGAERRLISQQSKLQKLYRTR